MKVFLCTFLIFAINIGVIATISCYVCSGYKCFATDQTKRECLDNTTTLCFYLTANNSDMFRGCYEQADPNYEDCKDHQLNTCNFCNTSLCNNQTPFTEDTLSCYKCSPASADCRDNMFITHHFMPCHPFMNTDRPACYSFYHHRLQQYEFGCMSEATAYVRTTCDHDWFKLTCQICYTDRCNVKLFYQEPEGGDVKCSTREGGEGSNVLINCPYAEGNLPYYGCYIETSAETWAKGCTSDRFKDDLYGEWVNLMKPPKPGTTIWKVRDLYVCKGQDCNSILHENHTYCNRNPVMSCSRFYDDIGWCWAVQHAPGERYRGYCADRYPCWKPELCTYRCQMAHVLSNSSKISCLEATWTVNFFCYTCSDCPMINNDHVSLIEDCAKKECGEALIDGKLTRGCRSASMDTACSASDAVCRFCEEEYCNYESYGINCITCTYENNLCTYAPVDTYNTKCDIPIVQNLTYGCYSQMRYDGLVQRGCYDTPEYECPESHVCETCNEDYCNRHLFLNGTCLNCTGDLNSDCANNETYIGLRNMTVHDECKIVFGIPLCYTIIERGRVRRGCTSDEYMPIIDKDCEVYMKCHFCDSHMCNFFTFSPKRSGRHQGEIDSSAWRIICGSSLGLGVLGVVWLLCSRFQNNRVT